MFSLSLQVSCCRRRAIAERQKAAPAEPAPEGWDLVAESESEEESEDVELRAPTGAELNDQNLRFYAVWKGSAGHHCWPGVHWSQGSSAYQALLRLNGGNFGGLKWMRASSCGAAVILFNEEKQEFGLGEAEVVSNYR